MFKVFITNRVLERIARDVNRPAERIGLLMGVLDDGSLWVNDIIPAGVEMSEVHCVFPPQRLAQVANDIVEGRIQGRIVGWYHSHPGYGIFMSETDLTTHGKLLQFSPFVVALVVDPEINEFGIWALEPEVGVVQVSNDYIRVI